MGIITSSSLDGLHFGTCHTNGDMQKSGGDGDVKLQRKFLAKDCLEIIYLELAIIAKEMGMRSI